VTTTDFFAEIPQVKIQWDNRPIGIPVFYNDTLILEALFLASLKDVRKTLPSARIHPLRVTPWHCIVALSAYQYRDSGIGPYNEVSISVPFILDRPSPVLMGVVRKPPEEPMAYIWHLPVTSEIARTTGLKSANFPKFLSDINFHDDKDWISCMVVSNGKKLLTLKGRRLSLKPMGRQRMYPVTLHNGYLLRLEVIMSECQMGSSMNLSDVNLELGDHPIAEELRHWHLGRLLRYQYCPTRQSILTPVFESFSVRKA